MWFDEQTANLLGGILGTAIGTYGGIIGIVCGICPIEGQARIFILKWIKPLMIIGLLSIIIGLAMLVSHQFSLQSFLVYYHFLFWGLSAIVAGIIFPRDNRWRIVINMINAMVIMGLLFLAFGGSAFCLKQPYHVWYPFLLCGGVLTFVTGCLYPVLTVVKKKWREGAQKLAS